MIKFVVGITGGSGVGKTTLINTLYEKFRGRVSTFSLDNYYLPREQQLRDENDIINFDLPSALDQKEIIKDLEMILDGNTIEQDVYSFNNPNKVKEHLTIEPKELLIVEGLFVMHYPFVREKLDYMVYLSVLPELQLERRLLRDMNERNYTEEAVLYQWNNHVAPSYKTYVEPYKKEVDLIITNNEAFDENIHILTSIIEKKIDSE